MATQVVNPEATKIPLAPNPEQQWLSERNTGIGGSEAYELLNLPQYGKGCSRALGYRKLGVEPDFPEEKDEALLARGTILEPLVAALYEEKTGRKVRRLAMNEHGLPRIQRNSEYPWAIVHTDRLILAGQGGVEETGDLEIKTHNEGPFLQMLRNGAPKGHRLQVQWSNFVTGHSWGALAVLGVFGGLPLEHFDVGRDAEMIDIFKREGDRLWNTLAKGQLPPPPLPADDIRCKVCAYRMECRGEVVDAAAADFLKEKKKAKSDLVQITNPLLANALIERDIVRQEIKACEETVEKIEQVVLDLQRDEQGQVVTHAYVTGYGKSYLTPSKWYGLDATRLKAEQPEVYEKYFVDGRPTGSNTLRAYPAKQ